MRFCDFFIEYKLGLKEISEYIAWPKLPLYRKLCIIIMFICVSLLIIFSILQKDKLILFTAIFCVISLVVFFILDSTPKKQAQMLKEHYKPYSNKRINMVLKLLNNYNITQFDTERINFLIDQAKESQIAMDPFLPIIKPFKVLCTVIIPIGAYAAQKVADKSSVESLVIASIELICIIICLFVIFYALFPTLRNLLYRDYSKYDDLIYDLNQIKIFQPRKISISANFSLQIPK
jgi:hypothetical protein